MFKQNALKKAETLRVKSANVSHKFLKKIFSDESDKIDEIVEIPTHNSFLQSPQTPSTTSMKCGFKESNTAVTSQPQTDKPVGQQRSRHQFRHSRVNTVPCSQVQSTLR
jgi:hypothetical protein